jgi:hypothetical protein
MLVLLFTVVSLSSSTFGTTHKDTHNVKSLMRDKVNLFGYANFVKHVNRSLNVSPVLNGFVRKAGECAYICANSSIGFSFNFAVNPDVYGRHACEILSNDMFNASDKLIEKPGFLHYSIFVSSLIRSVLTYSLIFIVFS